MILAKRLYGLQGLVTVKVLMQRNFLGGDGVDEDKVEILPRLFCPFLMDLCKVALVFGDWITFGLVYGDKETNFGRER